MKPEDWYDRLGYLLVARHGMAAAAAEEVVAECVAHCAETGEHPSAAFGLPEAFAARSAAERIPVLRQAGRDRDGAAPGEYLWAAVLHIGAWLVLGALIAWVDAGNWLDVTLAGLAGSVLLAGGLLLAGTSRDLYRAGRFGAARLAVAAVAVLIPVTATAFVGLPRVRIATLPTVVLVAVGVLITVVAWRLDPPRWVRAGGPADRGDRDVDEERDRWLSRLSGIMRGRHEWPRRRADRLVAEARDHLIGTGRRPEDEFGPVDVYALRSAQQVETPRAWWRRGTTRTAVVALALLCYLTLRIIDGDFGAMFVLNAGALAIVAFDLHRRLRRAGTRP